MQKILFYQWKICSKDILLKKHIYIVTKEFFT